MNAATFPKSGHRQRRWVFRTFVMVAAAMLLGSGVSYADEAEDATAPVVPAASSQVTEAELLPTTVHPDGQEQITMSTNGTRIG